MKPRLISLHPALCALALLGSAACAAETAPPGEAAVSLPAATPSAPSRASVVLARVQFDVEGMTCAGCVVGTRAALRKLEGVKEADASYENSSAWAVYDPAMVTPERMIASIGELGYRARVTRS